MELSESTNIEMCATLIASVLYKGETCFYSFKEIADQVSRVQWVNPAYIAPALERLIERKQLEHDPQNGYYKAGHKTAIQRTKAVPTISRLQFDRLNPREKMEYLKNGIVVN